MAGDQIAMAEDQIAMAGDQIAMAGDQIAMAGDQIAMAGDLAVKDKEIVEDETPVAAEDQISVKEKEIVEDETPVAAEEDQESGNASAEEEDTGAQIAPIIRFEEVPVSTGEENEEALLHMEAKLYRFDTSDNQWKKRGVGLVKILKHNETKKVRLLMRQNNTLEIRANHYLSATTSLQEHAGSDKSWVWHAWDSSEGEIKEEILCIRLGSVEDAQTFKSIYDEAKRSEEVFFMRVLTVVISI